MGVVGEPMSRCLYSNGDLSEELSGEYHGRADCFFCFMGAIGMADLTGFDDRIFGFGIYFRFLRIGRDDLECIADLHLFHSSEASALSNLAFQAEPV